MKTLLAILVLAVASFAQTPKPLDPADKIAVLELKSQVADKEKAILEAQNQSNAMTVEFLQRARQLDEVVKNNRAELAPLQAKVKELKEKLESQYNAKGYTLNEALGWEAIKEAKAAPPPAEDK